MATKPNDFQIMRMIKNVMQQVQLGLLVPKRTERKNYSQSVFSMKRLRAASVALVGLLIALGIAYWQYWTPTDARAGWWNDQFGYRQRLPISNSSGEQKTDFQIKLELDTASKITDGQLQADCDDMRFTNVSGDELHYWLEPNTCNSAQTIVFVLVPEIPRSGADLFWYYSSPTAQTASNPDKVFISQIDAAVANWPLDDTDATQSYARVINQGKELGRDIVINGGFDADSNWSKGTGWTISGGLASGSSVTAGTLLNQTAMPVVIGKSYQIEYTVSNYSSGTIRIQQGSGGVQGTTRSADGTYIETIVASGTTLALNPLTTFTGSIDNVSVRQVNIPSSASIDSSTELLVDGDMEAVDTSAWPSSFVGGATVTKQPGARTGGIGARVLRVERLAGGSAAAQGAVVTGKTYRTVGWARGDGVNVSGIWDAVSAQFIYQGPATTTWQMFDKVFLSVSNKYLTYTGNTNGRYAEFDDLSVREISPFVGRNTNGVTVGVDANGHLEKAYSFDGTNDNVNIYSSDLNSVFNPDEGTVVAWAKVNAADDWINGNNGTVFVLYGNANGTDFMDIRKNNNTMLLRYAAGQGTKFVFIPTTSTEWMQFVITWSKSKGLGAFYYNGIQRGTFTDMGDWTGNIVPSYTGIGGASVFPTGSAWKGLINDVRLYDRALSASEISSMYSADGDIEVYATDNFPGKELIRQFDTDVVVGTLATVENAPGPVAYWSFDSLEGTTVRDQSGNGNNGTNNGATHLTEDQCISGKCLRFDGSNDVVNMGDVTKLDFNQDQNFSIGLWFKSSDTDALAFSKKADPSSDGYDLLIGGGSIAGDVKFRFKGVNTVESPTWSGTNDKKWHYYTAVINREDQTLTVYGDGVQVGNAVSISTTQSVANASDFMLGARATGAYFQGDLDEVKIYPYARTADEIKQDYLAGAANAGSAVVLGDGDQSFLSNGLVGYWKMDEVSWNGTTGEVKDSSGNGNHGTILNSPRQSGGKFGNGLETDLGTTQQLSIPDPGENSLFDMTEQLTISAWLKSDQSLLGQGQRFVCKGYVTSWCFAKDTRAGLTNFQGRLNGAYAGSIGSAYPNGEWTHILVTFHHQQGLKFYTNGALLRTEPSYVGLLGTDNNSLRIANESGNVSMDGIIDEVRIYNRALSPAEVRALYEYAPGPIGHWKFDEGDGATAYDSSGNGFSGTITNPVWTEGKLGSALEFGSGRVVNFGNQSIPNLTTSSVITMSAWVKGTFSPTGSSFYGPIAGKQAYNNGGIGYGMSAQNGTIYIDYFPYYPVSNYFLTRTQTQLKLNRWYHVTGIIDVSNSANWKIYVDGELQPTTTTANPLVSAPAVTTQPFRVGQTSVTYQFFSGLIDDVRVYNYARTPDQIREDMLAGRPVEVSSTDSPKPAKADIDMTTGNERASIIDGAGADPIAYWDFNERSGTTLTDKSGNENNGTLVNGPEWVSGKYGSALAFDGVNDHVSVGVLDPTNPLASSVSVWFKTSQNCVDAYECSLVSSWLYGIRMIIVPLTNQLRFFAFNTAGALFAAQTVSAVNDNQWHHALGIFDGSNVSIYLDGQLIQTTPFSGTVRNDGGYSIGRPGAHSASYFQGTIDEVKIFDYALTPAQVAYEYNRGAPIAHWKMDECQGTTIHDASGNENHGTLNIGASGGQTSVGTCDTAGSAWGSGKVSRSNAGMSFDGVDDYVRIPDPQTGNLTESLGTISMWVNLSASVDKVLAMNRASYAGTTGIELYTVGSGSNICFRGSSETFVCTTDNALRLNTWTQVVVTYSGTTATIYTNGVRRVSGQISTVNASTQDFIIGGYGLPNSYFFDGLIDDVRIYNYALSADQVRTLYNDGAVSFR